MDNPGGKVGSVYHWRIFGFGILGFWESGNFKSENPEIPNPEIQRQRNTLPIAPRSSVKVPTRSFDGVSTISSVMVLPAMAPR